MHSYFDPQKLTKGPKESQELSSWKTTQQPVAQSSVHTCHREAMQECQNDGPIHGELFALGNRANILNRWTCYLCVSMSYIYIYTYVAHTEPIPGAHAWEGRWVMVPAILDSDSGGIISSSSSHLAWWPMMIHYLKHLKTYLDIFAGFHKWGYPHMDSL